MAAIHNFRQAISGWARRFSLNYRYCPDPKPAVAAAQEDLRRFSAKYWAPSPFIAAAAAIGTASPVLPDPSIN